MGLTATSCGMAPKIIRPIWPKHYAALAIRAHHALKIAQDRVDESIRVELRDLRNAIRWLEDEFRTQQLDRMLPYVVSLRNQIESTLG